MAKSDQDPWDMEFGRSSRYCILDPVTKKTCNGHGDYDMFTLKTMGLDHLEHILDYGTCNRCLKGSKTLQIFGSTIARLLNPRREKTEE